MRNKILLVIGVMLFILGQVGVNYLIFKSKNDQEISKVKLKNQATKKDSFAIMLEQDDGTYKTTTSTSFNQPGYIYNSSRSGCLDASGNKLDNVLSYNAATKSVSLRINSAAYCYIYFDMNTDYLITVKTEGASGKLPTAGGYKNTLNCSEGTASFNNKYQRLEITDVKANCTLNYEEDTATHTSLINTVQSASGVVHEVFNGVVLQKTDYTNLTNDATYPWTWNDTNNSWTSSNKGDAAKSTTSAITFTPDSAGNYQICYTQSSEINYDYGTVYKNDTEILSLKGKETTSYTCESIGNLTTSDTIKVTYKKDSSQNTGNDEVSFYIEYMYNSTIDAGYRYEGTNPNNYIWFNNEMWRIIGSIPTKVDASGTTTNLVKIIRKDSLGGIAYDAKGSGFTGAWESNTLYTLLNHYYYGDKSDVTNEAVCSGYSNNSKAKCDYSLSGISSAATDYYGRMVKNVYWNTGASDYGASASEVYATEKAKQTVQGRIGLMNASDYGYAASSANHNSTKMNAYNTAAITLSNWLYNQGYEWTNTQYSGNANCALRVYYNGIVSNHDVSIGGFAYRPVVYLSAEVYVISGSGTILDPYIIGM